MRDLQEIWRCAQAGNREDARRALVARLRADPRDVPTWLVLAQLLDDPEKRAACYRRVLSIDPGNRQAAVSLRKMEHALATRDAPVEESRAGPGHSTACPGCGAVLRPDSTACPYCGRQLREEAAIPDPFADVLGEMGISPENEPVDEEEADFCEDFDDEAPEPEPVLPAEVDELTQFVIQELGGHEGRDELIFAVCERGNMSWAQGEAFVDRVAEAHAFEIAKRRSPVTIILSGSSMLIGSLLLLRSLYIFTFTFEAMAKAKGLDMAESFMYLLNEIPNLLPGLAMVLGGLFGVARMVRAFRSKTTQ